MDCNKPLYVFVSHRHGDHFSKVIFSYFSNFDKVTYFLSDDISNKRVPLQCQKDTIFFGEDEERIVDGMKIRTLKSTDEGVAFLICIAGTVVYHAGDLQDWQWYGEPDEDNIRYRKEYRQEIAKLAGEKIDVAFLVLDPRQEQYYADGFDWFMKEVSVKWAVPMHCWEDFTVIERIKREPFAQAYKDRIIENNPFQISESELQ